MRLQDCVEIAAPRQQVWDFLADAENHRLFMAGLTRWDIKKGSRLKKGSRIDMRMAVGSAQVGSLIEVVECDAPADMAWTSVTGIDQRGRWRLRECGPGRTKVELRLAYQAPGGLLGWVVDQIAARDVRRNLRRSLDTLKEQVEAGAEPARRRKAG
jgi:uncharacterized membrane protein